MCIRDSRVTLRGVATRDVVKPLEEEAQSIVRRVVQGLSPGTSPSTVEGEIRRALSNFFYRQTKNRPELIVIPLEE